MDPVLSRAIAAVVRDPDDDDARLAAAARARVLGDPRAELIELQVARGRLRRGGRPASWKEAGREQALVEELGPAVVAEVSAGVELRGWELDRGFLARVTLDPASFVAGFSALRARAPVQHLDLVDLGGRLPELLAHPAMSGIRSLGLAGLSIGDAGAAALAAASSLAGLRWLELGRTGVGDDGIEALAASPILAAARYVGLAGNPGEDPRERALHVDIDETVLDVELPARGRQLIARYGERPWLRYRAARLGDHPPSRFADS
jgi:hypothetical protein